MGILVYFQVEQMPPTDYRKAISSEILMYFSSLKRTNWLRFIHETPTSLHFNIPSKIRLSRTTKLIQV